MSFFHSFIRKFLVIATLLLWGGGVAWGQLNVQINVSTPLGQGIVDEWGAFLKGKAEGPGALIQIMYATNGILAPAIDGTPHPNNPVITNFYIAEGTTGLDDMGEFSGLLIVNRSVQHKVFARVFNRPTREDSSFYADSRVFVTPTDETGNNNFILDDVYQTNRELDPNDDDDDGLSNSWEKSLGTDRLKPDTDEDGLSDHDEFLAGTDPLDSEDFLQMVELIYLPDQDIRVQWSSVPGIRYQAQFSTNALDAPVVAYTDLYDPVVAATNITSIIFTNGAGLDHPHFRVRLAP